MKYVIKGLLVFGVLGTASLVFAMNPKTDPNNNNNALSKQKELTPIEYTQKKLDCLLKRDPKKIFHKDTKETLPYNRLDLILTPQGMQFLMEELPLDLQKEIAREVLKSLPIRSKILQQIAVGYKELTGHTDEIKSIAFSPDDKFVLTGSYDNTARLWNIETGEMVHEFIGHTSAITSVTFSSDSRYILTGSLDKTERLWNIETGKIVHEFKGRTSTFTSAALSSDSKYLLTGFFDEAKHLWDLKTREMVHEFTGGNPITLAISPFSSNGRYIVTDSDDKTTCLWDNETKEMLHEFTGHASLITSVKFSLDNRYVLTGSKDGIIRLWDIGELKKVDNLLNNINISQLYLLMLINDALENNKKWCEISLEMQPTINSFDSKIKKILLDGNW